MSGRTVFRILLYLAAALILFGDFILLLTKIQNTTGWYSEDHANWVLFVLYASFFAWLFSVADNKVPARILPLLLVATWAIVSQLLRPGIQLEGLIQAGTFFRYIPLVIIGFYISSEAFDQKINHLIMFAFTAHFLVASAQYLYPMASFAAGVVHDSYELGISKGGTAGDQLVRFGNAAGGFKNNIEFACLALLVWAHAWTGAGMKTSFIRATALCCSTAAVLMSGSLGVFLVMAVAAIACYLVKKGVLPWGGVVAAPLMLSIAALYWYDSHLWIFFLGADIVEILMNQRLGVIAFMKEILLHEPMIFVFGVGADLGSLERLVAHSWSAPILLLESARSIEDVYWLALMLYFGFAWVLALAVSFYMLYRPIAWRLAVAPHGSPMSALVLYLVTSALALSFVNQAFEVSVLSFFIWYFTGSVFRTCSVHRKSLVFVS